MRIGKQKRKLKGKLKGGKNNMKKCSYCKKSITPGTRHYTGKRGGKYHISCGRTADVKGLTIKWTKRRKK